ncbi:MAG: 6-carboxytetrahydropterin synthase [Bacteroidota bacterium]
MVYITRREHFNAAHRLFRQDFTDQQNLQVFGKCSNPLWHGHNYELYVTVCGPVSPETGFVMDLKLLADLINQHIIQQLDHKNINLEVPFMQNQLASTENIAVGIWNQLQPIIAQHNHQLHCIKLCETENNYVEYYGEN